MSKRTPQFSVLIPSRNRLDLLTSAVSSVLRQAEGYSVEIVIADNASHQDYSAYVENLNDDRIRYLRAADAVSVTENWNLALTGCSGKYVVMLGDDDALAPDYFLRQSHLIEQFNAPDMVYSKSYHYCYPGVMPNQPRGYLVEVGNSELFSGHADAYLLSCERAKAMAYSGLGFRHRVSFNAQHFLVSRNLLDRMRRRSALYCSSYPDYYSCFIVFALAEGIVVDPRPAVIIGISKESFGFFLHNGREREGTQRFLHAASHPGDQHQTAAVTNALAHPGAEHLRNWLRSALAAEKSLGLPAGSRVDLRRYRRLQIWDMAIDAALQSGLPRREFFRLIRSMSRADETFARRALRTLLTLGRMSPSPRDQMVQAARTMAAIYYPAKVKACEIGETSRIDDAVLWLENRAGDPSGTEPADAGVPAPAAPTADSGKAPYGARVQLEQENYTKQISALRAERDGLASALDQAIAEARTAFETESQARAELEEARLRIDRHASVEKTLAAEISALTGQRDALSRDVSGAEEQIRTQSQALNAALEQRAAADRDAERQARSLERLSQRMSELETASVAWAAEAQGEREIAAARLSEARSARSALLAQRDQTTIALERYESAYFEILDSLGWRATVIPRAILNRLQRGVGQLRGGVGAQPSRVRPRRV